MEIDGPETEETLMKRTVIVLLVATCAWHAPEASAQDRPTIQDDPAAHALYDKMIESLRAARTLSHKSRYRWESNGKELGACTYHLRMKKPNFFRMDTVRSSGKKGGILIGDGDTMWLHWPNGRPFFHTEDPKTYNEPRDDHYMRTRTPFGRHSIAHQTGLMGAGMTMTVIDASTFHGYTDSLQRYIDGVTSKGTTKVDGETCDVILVSIMKGQRTWELALSRRDHLPRRLRQVVHVRNDIITEEEWFDVKVNAPISNSVFVWTPPEGWKPWRLPSRAERLLKPGTTAPDFTLSLVDGGKASLSDFRGKVVLLNIWRVG